MLCVKSFTSVGSVYCLPSGCVLNLSLVLDQFTVLPPGCVFNLLLVLDQSTVCHQVVLNLSLMLDHFHIVCDGIRRGTLDT